jgi:dihydrofolate reductase
MKSIVVAMDKQNGIGAKGDLLWERDMPADLHHFKQLTTGGTLIMGRKTFESIGRPLPGRENIVVSRSLKNIAGIVIARSLQEAYEMAINEKKYVIGGGEIYAQALDDMDALQVTHVDALFPEATTFFPSIDPQKWKAVAREYHEADERNVYNYEFVEYRPIRQSAL